MTFRTNVGLLLTIAGWVLAAPAQADGPAFLGKSAIQWHNELADKRPEVRRSAAFALGVLGKDALPAVKTLLTLVEKDDNGGVRDQIATALGDIALATNDRLGLWPRVGPVLQRSLAAEKDAQARRSLIYAIGAFGPTAFGARDLLKQALNDPREPTVRQNAAWALGRLGEDADEAVIKALCDQLKDGDALVRRDVATALGDIGKPASELAVPRMLDLVAKETDDVVRRTALEQLVNLVTPGDKTVVDAIGPIVRDKDAETARLAAFVVANIGGPEAVAALPILRDALKDDDSRMQGLAAAALARLGPAASDAVPDLAKLLGETTDPVTQRNCVLAFGRIGPKAKTAVPVLVEHLKPPATNDVRLFSAEAIARIGYPENKEALPALLDAVATDPDLSVRRACLFPYMEFADLRRLPDSKRVLEVVTAAMDIAGDDGKAMLLRYDAARTLAYSLGDDTPDKAITLLLHMLGNKDLEIFLGREAKVSGVGAEGGGGAAEVRINKGGDARFLAAQALGYAGKKAAGNEKVIAALKEAAEDKDDRLRKEASAALRKLKP